LIPVVRRHVLGSQEDRLGNAANEIRLGEIREEFHGFRNSNRLLLSLRFHGALTQWASHWFDQCDLKRFDRSGSMILLKWLDDQLVGGSNVRRLSKPSPLQVGLLYHVVFVPKRRRKAIFGNIRRQLSPILHALAKQKECQIVEGHLMPDHVHMCITIPPKHPVASVIGFLKGKSAIAIARLSGKERNFSGEHFWARGYAVSTVGFELEQVRQYIREQDAADGNGQFWSVK
jgi:putative transposase